MPLPRQSAEQIQQILYDMYETKQSCYLDVNNQIRAIPEYQSDLFQQSLPSILLQGQGHGHNLCVFDEPFIEAILRQRKFSAIPSPSRSLNQFSGGHTSLAKTNRRQFTLPLLSSKTIHPTNIDLMTCSCAKEAGIVTRVNHPLLSLGLTIPCFL